MRRWSWLAVVLSWACSSPSPATTTVQETSTGGAAGSSGSSTSSASSGASGGSGSSGTGGSGASVDGGGDEPSSGGGGSGQGGSSVADASGNPDATSEARQVCAAFANTVCAKIQSCTPFVLGVLYGDVATCKDRATIGCLPGFGAPGTSATPAKTAACDKAIAALACPAFLAGDLGAACKTDPGAVAVNGACADDRSP